MKTLSLISVCAVILIVLAGLSMPISAQEELAYDDGMHDGVYPAISYEQFLRQRFDVGDFPDLPFPGAVWVKEVKIFWWDVWQDFTVQIKLRDYDDANHVVDVCTESFDSGTSIRNWVAYDVPGFFVSDHFYVELVQATGDCTIGADTDPPPHYNMGERKRLSLPPPHQWEPLPWEDGFEADFMIRVIVKPAPIDVTIDIKPGSYPNSINLSSAGVISAAILSSGTFDATQVNPEACFLAGAAVRIAGKSANYLAHEEDVNEDGLMDIVCQFENDLTAITGDSIAVLEGETYDGTPIRGEDDLRIVPDN